MTVLAPYQAVVRCAAVGLSVLSLLATSGTARAQDATQAPRGLSTSIGFGPATSVGTPAFREAFSSGVGGAIGLGYQFGPVWSLRLEGGGASFSYDWSRWVPGRERYLPADGGSAPTADVWHLSAGTLVHLWQFGRLVPYGVVGLAMMFWDAGSARLDVQAACQFPGFNDPSWEPPGYCSQAVQETDVGGSGLGIDVGIGLRLRVVGQFAAYAEVQYLRDFGARGVGVVPLRVGLIWLP